MILKQPETVQASQSLSAGASVTSPSLDLRAKYGSYIAMTVTNGGTGPSTPPQCSVEISNDNFVTDVREVFLGYFPITANTTRTLLYRVIPEVLWARTKFTAGAGQASTVSASGGSVTSNG